MALSETLRYFDLRGRGEWRVIELNSEWNDYWRTARGERREVDPTGTDAIAPFFLAEGPAPGDAGPVLDLGCGAGALSQRLIKSNYPHSQFLGVDLSHDAAHMTASKTKGLAIQGDLANLPLAANTIDWAVSQFALEYASSNAWTEAGRVVKPGGRLTVVAHAHGSLIYMEHEKALADFSTLDQIIHASLKRDPTGEPVAVVSERILVQAIEQLRAMVGAQPGGLARPMSEALLGVLTQYSGGKSLPSSNELGSLLRWLTDDKFYKGRVESMLRAAMTPSDFMGVQQSLVNAGFTVRTAGFLTAPGGARLGFKLSAVKSA